MLALAADTLLTGLTLSAVDPQDAIRWMTVCVALQGRHTRDLAGFQPHLLARPRLDLRASLEDRLADYRVVPLAVVAGLARPIAPGRAGRPGRSVAASSLARWRAPFNIVLLVGLVLMLMNLEQTFRASRRHDAMADQVRGARPGGDFRRPDLRPQPGDSVLGAGRRAVGVESGALLIGCAFLAHRLRAHRVGGDRRLSIAAVIRSSLTVLIVGGYLFVVGVLAQMVQAVWRRRDLPVPGARRAARHGRPGGAAALGSRAPEGPCVRRPSLQQGAARFGSDLDAVLAAPGQRQGSCRARAPLSARLVSDTFDVLSVNVWLRRRREADGCVVGSVDRASARQAAVSGRRATRPILWPPGCGRNRRRSISKTCDEPWAGDCGD